MATSLVVSYACMSSHLKMDYYPPISLNSLFILLQMSTIFKEQVVPSWNKGGSTPTTPSSPYTHVPGSSSSKTALNSINQVGVFQGDGRLFSHLIKVSNGIEILDRRSECCHQFLTDLQDDGSSSLYEGAAGGISPSDSTTMADTEASLMKQLALASSKLSQLEAQREHFKLDNQLLQCKYQKEAKVGVLIS